MRIGPLDPTFIERFRVDLNRVTEPDARIGVAVSGGPDSVALLLLTGAVRANFQAATVDHGLRAENASEAEAVAMLCGELGVVHQILRVTVAKGASVQAQAREARYAELLAWAEKHALDTILTAHHADDQAETVMMRLARGAGVGGLAGVRSIRSLSARVGVVRPLLAWRKSELIDIAFRGGVVPVDDPSNQDPAHDRTHWRALLAKTPSLDPQRLSASASHARAADEALSWTTDLLAAERIREGDEALTIAAGDLPYEYQRRLLLEGVRRLAAPLPRGPDLDRLLGNVRQGRIATLGGLKFEGGTTWRLSRAPLRSSQLAASGSRSGIAGTNVEAAGASVENGARNRPVKPS